MKKPAAHILLYLTVGIFICTNAARSQVPAARTYSDNDYNFFPFLLELDSYRNLLISSSFTGTSDTCFLKMLWLDQSGNILNHKEQLLANPYSEIQYAEKTADGFLLAGRTKIPGSGYVPFIAVTDTSGNVSSNIVIDSISYSGMFNRLYAIPGGFEGYSSGLLDSAHYTITGNANASGLLFKKMSIANGNHFDLNKVISNPASGNEIIFGDMEDSFSFLTSFVTELDSTGIIWSYTYSGGGQNAGVADAIRLSNGNYCFITAVQPPGSLFFNDGQLFTIDTSGTLLWNTYISIQGGLGFGGFHLAETVNGDILVSISDANQGVRLLKLNAVGNTLWKKQFTGLEAVQYQVTKLQNNKFYIPGYRIGLNLLLTLDETGEGCSFVTDSTLQAYTSFVQTDPGPQFIFSDTTFAFINYPVVTDSLVTNRVVLCVLTGNPELAEISNQLKVYPNPFESELTVEVENNFPFSLSLTDLSGKLILYEEYPASRNSSVIKLETGALTHGTYLLTVFGKEQKVTRKIIRL